MWRARARCAYTVRTGGGGCALSALAADIDALSVGALLDQKRYSFKYATKQQQVEMRQPSYIHDKRHGVFSNERNVGKARRGLPYVTPVYTKHMNLWETDTDATTNRFFRSYVFGQRELHLLVGRPHGFEADQAAGRQGDSTYEINTDMRYKGAARPAITNLHYEPQWNQRITRAGAHGAQLSNPRSPFTEEILGPQLIEVRDVKSADHCKAWFDRLHYLIKLHYDAVGDVGDFKSRHTQHVHQFFVNFHDALSSFDFQDRYLLDQFNKVRPKELDDLFGIFIDMEANYVNTDFCPRCSLPYATTRYCGEGDPDTPFRKHRGRWAPHQRWGKEWFDVVTRRAEALWYRATEDPYFGTNGHTQRQVEGLLQVYAKTQQRAKAVDFVNRIYGSKEFLTGCVTITPAMQQCMDHLLDSTPHQHLLTNAFQIQSRASVYTGETSKAPLSPLQLRLDLEMNRFRRQQKEEGAVRVPPASWRIDTDPIVPYKLDANKRVVNWREVKAGIEKSFLATGLPREAYTSEEWREMLWVQERISTRGARREALEASRRAQEGKKGVNAATLVFPDKSWYRVFDTSAAALKAFGVSASGTLFTATTPVLPNPAAVTYTDPISKSNLVLDVTPEACQLYGDFESGDVLRVVPKEGGAGKPLEVVVVGVNKEGAESEWALHAMYVDPIIRAEKGLLKLGKDCMDIREHFSTVEAADRKAVVQVLADQQTAREEHLGQVVGVRGGQLYVQWRLLAGGGSMLDRSVAMPLGTPEVVRELYTIKELGHEALVEPPSWRTPFRNDCAEERLKELQEAPFTREKWASLIQGKYTPKVKKFGYTQHTTQDDFQTKEYTDRLLAKQFFTNPQAFEIIPERRERSVKFAGKWEYTRTHGVPTVDRNELENGWGEAEPVTDGEMQVIEQALRDISGRRPGNFIKSPTETQALRLNESWWAPLEFGWEEHNREQKAFMDSSEQKIIDSARLPFGGKVPPFGSTYGIGERAREVAADYAKGFGLGPHGHSPGHDTTNFNTLGSEERRVHTLGLGNALVRLFNEKLGSQDIHAWALQQVGVSDANVRQLLLSVQEWRVQGRAPSLLLCKVLEGYLKDDLNAFNAGLPDGVPRLQVYSPDGGATLAPSTQSGDIWADVDRRQYGYDYMKRFDRGDADEAYIVGLVQRANLSGSMSSAADAQYHSHLQQSLVTEFQLELAKIVGKGIPPAFTSQKTAAAHRGVARSSGNVVTFVRVSELAKLLRKMRVTSESVSMVVRGLANCPEHEPLGDSDFAVPTSLVLVWGGPGSTRAMTTGNAATGARSAAQAAAARASSAAAAVGRSGGAGRDEGNKMIVHALEEMALRDDGRVMDIKYAIRENRRNPVLRQEFLNAFLPVFGKDHRKVAQLYEDYCDGKYVPNITVAIEAFIAFLANISQHPELVPSSVEYFEMDTTGRHPGQYARVKLLPSTSGPFVYDCVLADAIETNERFHKYGILAGPTRVQATGFITANSKSLNYVTNRPDDIVSVTTGNDQGLIQSLHKSAHYKAISANPALRLLLQSPSGAGVVASFNRFYHRVTPMLNFYRSVLDEYVERAPTLRFEAQNANSGLTRALEGELSPSIEQEFRRNAERYWRNVLEGRNMEESAMMGGGNNAQHRMQSSAAAGAKRQREAGGGGGAGKFDLSRTLGQKPKQSEQRRGGGGGEAGGTGAHSNNSGGGESRSMSNLLEKLKSAQPSSPSDPRRRPGSSGAKK